MQLQVEGLEPGKTIDKRFAFGIVDPDTHVALGANRNPGIRWGEPPAGTRSLVLVCVDTDVPTRPDDVNQEGREVPASLPRGRFYHWLMVDIPPRAGVIAEGACSDGVTPRGKSQPPGPAGTRQGQNDYTGWFASDKDMAGSYLGYDGPCPPWNDAIPHHYHFSLYATDLERCPVEGEFSGAELEAAIAGHVLAEAHVTGVYSLNPSVGI